MPGPLVGRRALLRGCGAAIGLPFLEVMAPRAARAAERPLRYVVAFGGFSGLEAFAPPRTGETYGLSLGIQPLGGSAVKPVKGRPAYSWSDLRSRFNVVTGLRIGTSGPGALRGPWHSAIVGPLLSGVSSDETESPHPRGVTSDALVARALPVGITRRWLGYRVQPVPYREGDQVRFGNGTISHDGRSLLTPIHSPRAAYDQLFRDVVLPGESIDGVARMTLDRDRSVLDLVRGRSERLRGRLGRQDALRLEEHFTQIRELEQRLDALGTAAATAPSKACIRPARPGEDFASSLMPAIDDPKQETIGSSNEDARAGIMVELTHLAFVCDQARVASLMLTYPMSCLNVHSLLGERRIDLHDLGHTVDAADEMARAGSWHVEQVARLADRLKSSPEGDSNALDRTVIVSLMEGGCSANAHGGDEICVLVGGGKEAGLVQGRHIDGAGRHPASVLISALRALGLETDRLGDVTGALPELHA